MATVTTISCRQRSSSTPPTAGTARTLTMATATVLAAAWLTADGHAPATPVRLTTTGDPTTAPNATQCPRIQA